MQVKEIMTKNPACCTPDSNLKDVSRMMVDNDCGCIPVVENKQTMKPIGTITDRDITIRTVAAGKNPLEMTASDIMTTDVVTIKSDISVDKCSQLMKENNIRRVIVVDQSNKCCGIVAQADIAEYGPNPALISDVVHDISESAHTPVKSDSYTTKGKKSGKNKSSLLSLNSVVPLAVGVAAGAAYKYFYGSNEKSETKNVENLPAKQKSDKMSVSTEKKDMSSVENKLDEPGAENKVGNTVTENKKDFSIEKNDALYNPEIGIAANQK